MHEEPESLPVSVPAWLRQVTAKALRKNPVERYQSVEEMRAALMPSVRTSEERIQLQHNVAAPPQPQINPQPRNETPSTVPRSRPVSQSPFNVASEKSSPQPRRSYSVIIATVIGLTVIAVAGYLMTRESSEQSTKKQPAISATLNSTGKALPDLGATFVENLNGVKLEMMRVPGGSFTMGSPDSEEGRGNSEGPQHQVAVPSFYIGRYEVTQAQWEAVMGNNPSRFKGDDLPVEKVSWNETKVFCRKLSQITGKNYRLPSEAEWEYACRAKTTSAYAGDLDSMAWYSNNSGNKTHPVGQKQPNEFGLYDMHGNVWEWCEDVWHKSYEKAPDDGSSWLSDGNSSYRALRGGSWLSVSRRCRSALRYNAAPGSRNFTNGFRVVVGSRTS
jgi:formylglycine-generating enzyme required for sulfatase activity